MSLLVRSAYLDTNVYVEATVPGRDQRPSARAIHLGLARRVGVVGSSLLRKELQGVCRRRDTCRPMVLYEEVIVLDYPGGRREKHLARVYRRELGINASDALHLALAVSAGVDLFVSWNRKDLARASTRLALASLNPPRGLGVPAIVTPRELEARADLQSRRGRLFLR